MGGNLFYHHRIALGTLALAFPCLALWAIFSHGFVSARLSAEVPELALEMSQEALTYRIVPDFANPLSVTLPKNSPFDLVSDDSLHKYISDRTPFVHSSYVPIDLVPIHSNFTANHAKKFLLRQEAADMFADMAWHFRHQLSGDKLYILSAYRSKTYQDGIFARCKADACAKGGASEHQAGLAVDLRVLTRGGKLLTLEYPNTYTDWLHAHAHQRGFHNTYQKGVAIDGKIIEGWHWRYMGVELATLLWEQGMTIAEYYNGMNK